MRYLFDPYIPFFKIENFYYHLVCLVFCAHIVGNHINLKISLGTVMLLLYPSLAAAAERGTKTIQHIVPPLNGTQLD